MLRLTVGFALVLATFAPLSRAASQGAKDDGLRVRFRKIAVASGVRFSHQHSPTPAKHFVESVPGGLAVFDYDGDGRLDLFVVNYVRWSPAADSFCGDEARGIRIYCHPRVFEGLPNRLYRNRGDGTFEDVSTRSGLAAHVGKGMSTAFADFDRDGDLDIFVTNDTVPNFLFRNNGDGTLSDGMPRRPNANELLRPDTSVPNQ